MSAEPTTTPKNVAPKEGEAIVSSSTAAAAPSSSSISLPPNRFELELEFVQSLASPAYLHYLATSGTLYQQSFLDFLRYLRYWKQPQYAKYILYPHCLYFLDLLVPPSSDPDDDDDNNSDDGNEEGDGERKRKKRKKNNEQSTSGTDSGEAFRREIAQVPFRNFVHEQQFYSWQFRSARLYGRGSEETKDENVEVGGEGAGGN